MSSQPPPQQPRENGSYTKFPRNHPCTWKTYVGASFNPVAGLESIPEPNANVKIKQIQFQAQTSHEIESNSVLEVTQRQYYIPQTQSPARHGPLDGRLGTSAKDGRCSTCFKSLVDCVGHFGHVSLELPVFHIGYMREIQRTLQMICKRCSRVLLPTPEHYEYYTNQMRQAMGDKRKAMKINDDILEMSKRVKCCPWCSARNGQVKKVPGLLKIIHDLRQKETKKDRERKLEEEEERKRHIRAKYIMTQRQAQEGSSQSFDDFQPTFTTTTTTGAITTSTDFSQAPMSWKDDLRLSVADAVRYNNEISSHIDKVLLEISPLQSLRLFLNIPNEDCFLLNLDPALNRPETLILTKLPVPPVCIRPSVSMGVSGTNEDDLTIKIGEIVQTNLQIQTAFKKGLQTSHIIQQWDFLQQQVAQYINSDLPGVSKSVQPIKPIRALVQRLKGKQGRFRGNLSGKRVDFSGRTVISPDPNLSIDQVGVPQRIAKILTFPERVTQFNITRLRTCVLNGPDTHPGANSVEWSATGRKVNLRFAKRVHCASQLAVGDIVERHLDDNDVVLFNRQPSLHRMSIMAHRVKVHEWRTLRFNECVCTPYNADFDGDEMNIHLPQTYEAKSEASELMSVLKNLVTPRHGEPLVCATQDFITGAFLITSKNRFISRTQFLQYTGFMDDAGDMSNERLQIPIPAILKPIQLWTGKQCFSFILSPQHQRSALSYIPTCSSSSTSKFSAMSDECKSFSPLYHHNYTLYKNVTYPSVTVELRASNCRREHCMDSNDGYIVIRNSELMSGNITKDALGGSKKGMYYQIIRAGSDGVLSAARFLSRLAKFASRFVQSEGFSIGIDDVTPSQSLTQAKQQLVDVGYAKSLEYIEQYKQHKLQLRPGCNELQTLEALLLGELSAIRSDAGQKCFDQLNILYNTPLIMAVSGSKGSKINISQMTACVGQQAISGSRIPEGFHLRTLPHFPKFSRDPNAKGFVQNSFYTGLTATEFFFHTMGGREGLVDTAVKTAETGYMQRRLLKALEDLCVQYDRSVRTSDGNICQFTYGDDGLDPLYMADAPLPVNFPLYWEQIRAVVQDWHKPYLTTNNRTMATLLVPSRPAKGTKKALTAPEVVSVLQNPALAAPTRMNTEEAFKTAPRSIASIIPKALLHQFTTMHYHRLDDTRQFVDFVSIVLSHPYLYTITEDMIAKEPALEAIRDIISKFIPPIDNKDNRPQLDISAERIAQLQHPHTYLLPDEMMAVICGFAMHPQTIALCSTRFILTLLQFAEKEYVAMTELMNTAHNSAAGNKPEQPNIALLLQVKPLTSIHLNLWLNGSKSKYLGAIIESGTAVGAIAGQSIGEPGTQMTLKTFHFAGVASMNITQGVPRIKEIINASKKIATPIITAPLEVNNDPRVARLVKGRIETTTLGQIARSIEAFFTSFTCGIDIELDQGVIEALQLNITIDTVLQSLRAAKKLKLKDHCHTRHNVHGNLVITISNLRIDHTARTNTSYTTASSMLQLLHSLKHEVAKVIIQGIPTVSRAVINDEGNSKYSLIVEGYDMLSVMGTAGVCGTEVRSNHVIEVCQTLGIEAARTCIITEIKSSMDNYGLTIDMRHMSLLADIMTYRGEVLGITRFGIAKMKESTLMLASFEKTSDHLFEAALRGVADDVNGVSESIILGKTIPIGTGLFRVQQQSLDTTIPTSQAYNKLSTALINRHTNTSVNSSNPKGNHQLPGLHKNGSGSHFLSSVDVYAAMRTLDAIERCVVQHDKDYVIDAEKERQLKAHCKNDLDKYKKIKRKRGEPPHLQSHSVYTTVDPFATKVPLIKKFASSQLI